MSRILNASVYVPSFSATGNLGEYLIENAVWENQADVTGNGVYDASLDDVLYVQAVDVNTSNALPGIIHRYKFTSLTPIDSTTFNATVLWDEVGPEMDAPANGSYALYSKVTPIRKFGTPPSDMIYSALPLGSSLGALSLNFLDILDQSSGGSGQPLSGAIVLTGQGVPDSSLGIDSNNYLDIDTGNWYTKDAGTWTFQLSLKGPQGPAGTGGGVTSVAGRQGAILLSTSDIMGLAQVASSGDYSDLNGKPNFSPVATSGAYLDLTGRPSISVAAVTGSYTDLFNKPNLAPVATSGAYADITGKPSLAPVATSGAYADLTGKPALADVATSGSYADLWGTPTIPSPYVLPTATTTVKGGVKQGTGVTIAPDGTLSVSGGAGSGGGGVFVTSIVPYLAGTVTNVLHAAGTVPANVKVVSADANAAQVEVHVGASGGTGAYSPTVTVNGVEAVLTESPTTRWFTGSAIINLSAGVNTVVVNSSAGGTDTVTITASGVGPTIASMAFGAYPGVQTSLKAGDSIPIIVNCSSDTAQVVVQSGGASSTQQIFNATAGVATGNLIVGSASGSQSVTATARNSLGASGDPFVSPTLELDQAAPSLVGISVNYPSGKTALAGGNVAQVTCTVTGFTGISYVPGANLSIPNSTVYALTKSVTCVGAASSIGVVNYTINATKASNGASASISCAIDLAGIAPTAVISIVGSPARLISSAASQSYTVRITPDQVLSGAPSLNASSGTWNGSWILNGSNWERQLLIRDIDTKGAATFSSLSMPNRALVNGTSITSGASYTVGGFTVHSLQYSAFSQIANIGTPVTDITKVHAKYNGAVLELTRRVDTSNYVAGFTVTDSLGVYSVTGDRCFITDTAFAGANTSGTLVVDIWEDA